MLRNYLVVAWRNLMRHKLYAVLNVTALTVGLTSCLLIGIYVLHELSYDRFHPHADRLYRVTMRTEGEGQPVQHVAWSMTQTAEALATRVPAVEEVARIGAGWGLLYSCGDERWIQEMTLFADGSFFTAFGFPLIQGDPSTALSAPYQVVLADEMARRLFPDLDPIGQVLTLNGAHSVKVTGVLRPIPANTHLKPQILLSYATADAARLYTTLYTYVRLTPSADPRQAERLLAEVSRGFPGAEYWTYSFVLQPVRDIHLRSDLELSGFPDQSTELSSGGDLRLVRLFGAIAVIVLALACTNYANLAIARSIGRAGEIGLRRAIGAQRRQLIAQFLVESLLVCVAALFLAIDATLALMPVVASLLGVELQWSLTGVSGQAGLVVGLALLAVLGTGVYPAAFLARLAPATTARGGPHEGWAGASKLRQALIVFQFAASIALTVAAAVTHRQLTHIGEERIGFDKGRCLVVQDAGQLGAAYASFKQALLADPKVQGVTTSSILPARIWTRGNIISSAFEGVSVISPIAFLGYEVDTDFTRVLGIGMKEGRDFSSLPAADAQRAVIINTAFVQRLGLRQPVGTRIQGPPQRQVIGVVGNFSFTSARHEDEPAMLSLTDAAAAFVLVKMDQGSVAATLERVRQVWQRFVPSRPLQYSFLEDDVASLYRKETRLSKMCEQLAAVAILMACLGLFGLSAFSAECRTREIGVRKVLGSSVSGIVLLLSRDYAGLVILANLIACPVAYLGLRRWLDGFAYRVDLGPGVFLCSAALTLAVACLTVGWHAVRAALANPVDALRQE